MAQLKNTTINDTGFLQLPAGTTAQRPGSAQQGQLRYNTETRNVEWYDSTYDSWFPTGVVPPIATGGTITNITQGGVNYRVHTFTTTGTSTFTVTRGGQVEFLIVAGGGGGGDGAGGGGGGGGAGGLLLGTTNLLTKSYEIIVGNGGPNGVWSNPASPGVNGENSSAFGFTALGGGGGGGSPTSQPPNSTIGRSGGSGGGGYGVWSDNLGGTGTPGQGLLGGRGATSGANRGGGGGGAAYSGQFADTTLTGGNGGSGIASNITGTIQFYAGGAGGGGNESSTGPGIGGLGGGGNGGWRADGTPSTPGEQNTGGGGGGNSAGSVDGPPSPGGTGIVIIRYRIS